VSLSPGTPVGRYVIRRKLAEGGMAEIFLAQSHGPEGFEKQVVIKRIRAALADDPSFVQMFIAEARVASKLNHANVVHIFDFDRHEDSYYLAMEYVRGKSLAEVHRRSRSLGRPMPPVLAAQIGLEVARGLGYAHRLNVHGQPVGLVHRDVTPHNVLLSYEGAVKLTDFGIAKASNRASTAGMLKGKFAYMSPEQSRGEPVDARTDLFALGISLWELLTGARLFDGDSDLAVLRAVQERDIVAPSTLNPDVEPPLSDAIMSALERDPSRRVQSAAELERRLLTYVIHATRTPEDTDVGRFVRALFPDDAAAEEDTDPAVPLQLVSRSQPTAGAPSARGAAVQDTRRESEGRLLQQTLPSAGKAVPGDEAFAPTQTPAARRFSAATAPGQGSAVTHAPGGPDTRELAAELGGGRGRLKLAVLGVAVVLGGGAIAFVAGQREPHSDPGPAATPLAAVPSPPAVPAVGVPAPSPPPAATATARTAAVAPGFLLVTAQPWGKLFVDGKFVADVEEPRQVPLPPGTHTVRVQNGKKSRSWTLDIESGRTQSRRAMFIEE